MNILLIEDMAGFAEPIQAQLEALGHSVTWVIGVERIEGSRLTGILRGPDATALTDEFNGEPERLVQVDLSQIQLALVDGDFFGMKNGDVVIPHLVRNNIVCVAISAGGGNASLLKAGAQVALSKEFVMVALRSKQFDPDLALRIPETVNRRLAAYTAVVRAEAFSTKNFDYGYPGLS
jgi:CheY-like chemotaxis protein